MNAVAADSLIPRWTWRRWLTLIAIVFAAHVALIFIFGARKPVSRLSAKFIPSLTLANELPGGLLALNDATLFALPDGNGFAGPMWLELPLSATFQKQNWNEEPRWLAASDPLSVSAFGAGFNHLMQTNRFADFRLEYDLSPPLAVQVVPPPSALMPPSRLQIQGEIANRPLVSPLDLPSWPETDVIAPSVVQVLVDAAGEVVSAVLLPPENTSEFSEGSAARDPAADRCAVQLARAARFTPLTPRAAGVGLNPGSRLALGRLIFNWQTVPVTTNANPR